MLDRRTFLNLCRSREVLRENVDGLPIRRVAHQAGISTFYFIRQFQAVFGETPHQCRIRARLDRAKHLLATTDLSVTAVCLEVGCSSLGSFSDLFTRRVGVSPSSYRKQVRAVMPSRRILPPELIPGCLTLMGAAFATFEKQPIAFLSDSNGALRRSGAKRRGRAHEDQAHQHHGRRSGQGAEVLHGDLRIQEEA